MENKPQPSPNDPQSASEAHEGTPQYGSFGHANDAPATAKNDGSNDNPDEFSELPSAASAAASPQIGHVDQNQDTAAIIAAHGGGDAEERAAYALDDPRYAGGEVYDLKNEQTSL